MKWIVATTTLGNILPGISDPDCAESSEGKTRRSSTQETFFHYQLTID